jgi:cysteine desulfurase
MKKVYMDYASSTPVDKAVLKEMVPYFNEIFGNASSIHTYGRVANEACEKARKQVSNLINANQKEIIFTSGGTESDNMAVKGSAYLDHNKKNRNSKGPHIITSTIEHPAILQPCKHLEKQGFKVKYLPVDNFGLIDINDLKKSISKDTFLISIMYANNEIGTIEPIEEIGEIARENNIIFHTDAIQAIGKIPIDVKKLNIDMLSISSHKIYGPKGVGALFIRRGVKIQPIVHGGGHEMGLRSSTYNTPGIVGLGKACELIKQNLSSDINHLKILRDLLINNVLEIEESYLNGHPEKRLANNAHFRFSAIEGESLNMMLNEKGIAASTGSACSSEKLETSHVLSAIGLKPEDAHGSLRLTVGRYSKNDDIKYVCEVLPEIVNRLRKMSPLWAK